VKVYLRTFGCRANHYDTEAVRELVESNGHAVVSRVGDADVAVFNSCAVTSDAEAELRKVVRRASKDRPGLRSIVMGCAAALDDERPTTLSIRALPTVQHVVAGADLPAIADALELRRVDSSILTRSQAGARALLRIQDGCDEHCTFCATTHARGANRSRAIGELLAEARALADRHPEIVLAGIHIGTYGTDIGSSLGELVTRLVSDIPTVRFRLSSIEATEIDAALAALLIDEPSRLAPHVHAPLQSGSDRVLRRMGRNWYTAATYSSAIERLAGQMPVLGLGADVICGFPGETDDDHRATVRLVEDLPFTYLHVFPFSPRPGTAALKLSDSVPPSVANARAAELRELVARKAAAYVASRIGGVADVVVVGAARQLEGITDDYLTVAAGDDAHPRGTRFTGRLARHGAELVAMPETIATS
jgi:threonylcarbamoyladenosine tRNA methylthiotransferase MtaB